MFLRVPIKHAHTCRVRPFRCDNRRVGVLTRTNVSAFNLKLVRRVSRRPAHFTGFDTRNAHVVTLSPIPSELTLLVISHGRAVYLPILMSQTPGVRPILFEFANECCHREQGISRLPGLQAPTPCSDSLKCPTRLTQNDPTKKVRRIWCRVVTYSQGLCAGPAAHLLGATVPSRESSMGFIQF